MVSGLKLDIGCGGGVKFKPRPRGDINCDINIPLSRIPNFIRCDAHFLPFKSDIFNGVFMFEVLEHLVSPLNALREARRVLCEKGVLELSTPNALFVLKVARALKRGFYSPYEDHIATWGKPELENLLRKANFRNIRISYPAFQGVSYKFIERLLLILCVFKSLRPQLLVKARKRE
jgi:SAM-dependent methyltransferase